MTGARPRDAGEAVRELHFSVTAEVESHLMAALIQYGGKCRRDRMGYPPMLDQIVLQLSQRFTRGQESSTFAAGSTSDDAGVVDALVVTREQAAKRLACSVSTVKRRIESGELPVVRSGRLVRIRQTDLDEYLETHLDTKDAR